MAEHPNVVRVRALYAALAQGDLAVLRDVFAEDLLWHQGGRNQLSGEYRGREAVLGLFGKVMEVTQGSFRTEPYAVLADDEHCVGLVVVTASKAGRSVKVNALDVMHVRDGKVVELWTVPTDQYAFDELIG